MSAPAEPPPVNPRRNPTVWQAAVILLAGLFIYAPVFSGDWLLDDNLEVTANSAVQDPAGLAQIWRGGVGADYLPLKTSVQWLLWQVFGNHPTPFHLASIALHLLSAFLFWRLLGRLGMRYPWLGGALFVAHPVAVESVAWVSELKNTLSLALLLLAMLRWVAFDERRRARDYAWSLGWFAAALLCKASVIMWPVVILLHAWWKRGRLERRDAVASLPFFAVSLAAGAATVALQASRAIKTDVYPLHGLVPHLALAGADLAFYLWKIVLPMGLLPMYRRWQMNPPGAVTILPWLLFGALFYWLWQQRRRPWQRTVCLGLGFFVVNLLPVLGFLNMSFMRIAWVSDHFVYLPLLGIAGLTAVGASTLYDHADVDRRSYLRGAGWVGLAALVIASRVHTEAYTSLEGLCQYTIQRNPEAWLAHQLYSGVAGRRGDFDLALAEAKEAVRLRPDDSGTQNNLGLALDFKGRHQEARIHLQEALRLDPGNPTISENLARSLLLAKQYEPALQEYLRLLEHSPRNAGLRYYAGVCLMGSGHLSEAIDEFRQALAINPGQPGVQDALDFALKRQKNAGRP